MENDRRKKNFTNFCCSRLRNPITIIKGYTEYLQENLEYKDLSNEKIIEIIK